MRIIYRVFVSAIVGIVLTESTLFADSLLRSGEPKFKQSTQEIDALYRSQFLPVLVQELSPAVVNISVETNPQAIAEKVDPLAGPQVPGNPFRSAGSGFIVREDGYVVTCSHVIEKASQIIVRLMNSKDEYPAVVVGRDPKTDLALLKIEREKPFPAVYVGDSDEVQVGEWVVAIGNQFQLGQTVTTGIVSAKARKVPTRGTPYDSFLQTDASINPGSSGGPLFNARGQVVGINSAIFSPGQAQLGGTGFNIGIGFSVPVNLLKQIIAEMMSSGTVARGMLGVRIQEIDKAIQKVLRLSSTDGALVSEVLSDTPASRAGIKRRDVITHFNSIPIQEFDELPLLVANAKIGTQVALSVVRKGKAMTLNAVVTELKGEAGAAIRPLGSSVGGEIGISVEELTEVQAKALGLESAGGIFVTGVTAGSIADRAGIRKGDLIEEIGDVLISNNEVLRKVLAGLVKGEDTLLTVRRIDGTRILTIKIN